MFTLKYLEIKVKDHNLEWADRRFKNGFEFEIKDFGTFRETGRWSLLT